MSKLKKKLSDEVDYLAYYDTEDMLDMTQQMQEIYLWGLNNAPIRQLREWKKQFKQDKKEREQEEQE
tara:strand:+ start:350 stop:550 length:201 start_codon:yes stop_codon:yes gene_type:complete